MVSGVVLSKLLEPNHLRARIANSCILAAYVGFDISFMPKYYNERTFLVADDDAGPIGDEFRFEFGLDAHEISLSVTFGNRFITSFPLAVLEPRFSLQQYFWPNRHA
jgi:hypothetical protein